MEIIIKQHETNGYALARENEKRAGAMSYSITNDHLIIIDHTEVAPEYNGMNVGLQMLVEIVAMAREKGIKIIPLCPFAAAMFKRKDEFKDVLKLN